MTRTAPAPARRGPGSVAVVTCTAVLLAVLLHTWRIGTIAPPDPAAPSDPRRVASVFDPPRSRYEVSANEGDGQVFAAMATDPFLRRPELFSEGPDEAAYRWQRPLLPLAIAATGGADRDRVARWMFAWTLASVALLAAVGARWMERLGAPPLWAAVIPVLPGVHAVLRWGGPEALGTALALAGALAWTASPRRTTTAVVLLAGAALCRETLLLVPVALLAHAWCTGERSRRALLPLVVPAAVFSAWVALASWRMGGRPWDAASGRLSAVPFTGLLEGRAAWNLGSSVAAVSLAAAAVAAIALLAVAHRHVLAWVGVAFAGLAAVQGPLVWTRWQDFGRPLLPLSVVGLVLVAAALARAGRAPRAAPAP